VLTWSHGKASASITSWTWWLAPAVAAAIMIALFGFWWLTLASGGPGRGARRARPVAWAAAITAGLALITLAVPPLIAWLYHSTGALGTIVRFFGFGGSGHWSPAALAGLVTAMVAVGRSGQKQLARLRLPKAAGGPPQGMITKLAGTVAGKLAPWLASLLIVAAGTLAALLWMGTAARAGFSLDQLVPVLVALAVMLATRVAADINRTSLHDVYRWRLADAYAVTRKAAQQKAPEAREKLMDQAARTRLSELASPLGVPGLVIATTANINANREVPAGRGGFCLAFDPEWVTLRGKPDSTGQEVQAATADYEHLLGHTRLTLFDVVAISGAAFSPLMGAATRGAYRIVLTLANLRLGVWMPHPDVVRRARNLLGEAPAKNRQPTRGSWLLLLWYVAPHPFWHGDAAKQEERETRLWAHVLDLRERRADLSAAGKGRSPRDVFTRLRAAVCWRAMQPTLGMLWAEAVGHTSYRATWVNVTDGGHYDNLGLVEALHRDAKNVVVLDASGDRTDTWFTFGGAVALARADAGVEISLDPTTMIRGNAARPASGLENGQVLRPWAYGTFTRPDGRAWNGSQAANGGAPSPGNIRICKLGWWIGVPWDVRAYAAGHPGYPCDPTMQQLYDGSEFEAYHELGACTVAAAAGEGLLPLASRFA
jgi:hypothetical protein